MFWMANFQQLCRWGRIIKKAKRRIKRKWKTTWEFLLKMSVALGWTEGAQKHHEEKYTLNYFFNHSPHFMLATCLRMLLVMPARNIFNRCMLHIYRSRVFYNWFSHFKKLKLFCNINSWPRTPVHVHLLHQTRLHPRAKWSFRTGTHNPNGVHTFYTLYTLNSFLKVILRSEATADKRRWL